MTTAPTRPDPSASYAAEVMRLLWPSPWTEPQVTRSSRRPRAPHRDVYAFPTARNPRLLVPADVRGAATMVQRLGHDDAFLVGPSRRVLRAAVGSPFFSLARWPRLRVVGTAPGDGSLEGHLSEVLGTDVRAGVVLGPRRVNQKPVLQLFGTDGALLGFAKVGHNDLTAELVRHEARALAEVARHEPRRFRAPALLHAGSWSGLDLLVMSPLRTEPGRPVPVATRDAAMVELARLRGVRTRPLAGSPFLERLRALADRLAGAEHGAGLPGAVAALEEAHGSVELAFGGWHGDWGPWNMGMEGDVLQLWDWERHDADVPLGFDGVHLAAQDVRPRQAVEPAQEAAFAAAVPAALAPFGVDPALHPLTTHLYLLEMALRYVDALRHGARPDFACRTAWVVSYLDRCLDRSLDRPTTRSPEGRP